MCKICLCGVTMINSFLSRKVRKNVQRNEETRREKKTTLNRICSLFDVVLGFVYLLEIRSGKNGCSNEMYHHYWNRCHRLLFGKHSRLCVFNIYFMDLFATKRRETRKCFFCFALLCWVAYGGCRKQIEMYAVCLLEMIRRSFVTKRIDYRTRVLGYQIHFVLSFSYVR